MRWKLLRPATLPRPLHFHGAASAGNGVMYVFGGIEKTDDVPSRTNHVYRVWVTVPKLSDICWTAMTALQPDLPQLGFERLVREGVPEHFVKRLKMSDRTVADGGSEDDGEGSWRTVSSSSSSDSVDL